MKVWYHNGAIFINPIHTTCKEALTWLTEAGKGARREMDEARADHAVYGTKRYDPETGDLIEVSIYAPAVLLNDAEFERRIAAHLAGHPGDLILAHHKF